jgi:hypothetical protein
VNQHNHSCARCLHEWPCTVWMEKPKRKVCIVTEAARVNKQGPFCELCRGLLIAEAAANLRGLRISYVVEPK